MDSDACSDDGGTIVLLCRIDQARISILVSLSSFSIAPWVYQEVFEDAYWLVILRRTPGRAMRESGQKLL